MEKTEATDNFTSYYYMDSSNNSSNNIEARAREVLHNVNWLLDAHDSHAELVEIEGNKVVVHCTGFCADCETDCVGVAFRERMPDIELVFQ